MAKRKQDCPVCQQPLDVYDGDENEHKVNTGWCKKCGARYPLEERKSSKDGEEELTAAGPQHEGTHASRQTVSESGIRNLGHTDPDTIERSGPSGDAPPKKP